MKPLPYMPEKRRKSREDELKEAESRRQAQIRAMSTTELEETPSYWGEFLLPFLFAAMETCWIDAIFIALAGFNLFQSKEPFMPLWSPFVLIAGTRLLLGWFERRAAERDTSSTGESAGVVDATTLRGSPVLIPLIALLTLIIVWASIYAQTTLFFDPRWLLSLLNDLLLLNLHALHLFGIIALSLYFCWRGARLLYREYEPGHVIHMLYLGIGVIFAVIVVRAGQGSRGASAGGDLQLLLTIPVFLFLVLISHALARVTFARRSHPQGLQGNIPAQERAIIAIIGVIGLFFLAVAWIVASLASPSALAETRQFFGILSAAYDWLARLFATVVIFVVTPISWFFSWLFSVIHPKWITAGGAASKVAAKKIPHAVQYDPTFILFIKLLIPIALIIVAVLLVRWLLRKHRRVHIGARQAQEVRESLWSWSLFWGQIKALLWALFGRFFPRRSEDADSAGQEEHAEEPAVRSIRDIYRALLKRAAQRGYPRRKSETPDEFRQRLDEKLPVAEPQLSAVTEVYKATRYGGMQPDAATIALAQRHWSELAQKLQAPGV